MEESFPVRMSLCAVLGGARAINGCLQAICRRGCSSCGCGGAIGGSTSEVVLRPGADLAGGANSAVSAPDAVARLEPHVAETGGPIARLRCCVACVGACVTGLGGRYTVVRGLQAYLSGVMTHTQRSPVNLWVAAVDEVVIAGQLILISRRLVAVRCRLVAVRSRLIALSQSLIAPGPSPGFVRHSTHELARAKSRILTLASDS
jgi:hypothetical protein